MTDPRSPSLLRVRRVLAPVLLSLVLTLSVAEPALAKKGKEKADEATIGQVAGVVSDQEGQRLEGIEIELVALPDRIPVGAAVTDKKGEFELTVQVAKEDSAEEAEGPVSGSYEITLHGVGYATFSDELELSAGERLDIELTMLSAAAGRRNEAIAFYNEGVKLHADSKMEEAAAKFRQAIEVAPDVAQAYLGLADVAIVTGNPQEGLEAIEKYLELEPEDEAGKRVAYEIYRALGRMDEAKALAEEMGFETADKDLAIQVYNEGAVASQKSDYDTALAKFEQAVQMDPTLGPAWAGIASIYYNRGELEQALEPAQKAVELQPDHEGSVRIRFLVLDALGKTEAADAWETYRQMNQPAALDLLYRRAELDFRNDGIESARAAAEKILTVDADHAGAHLVLGKLYSSTDVAKAKAHLQKVVELLPADDPNHELAKSMLDYL